MTKQRKEKIIFGDEFLSKKEIEKQKNNMPFKWFKDIKNKKILEMGCGVGWYVYLFSLNNKADGIEINERRLEIAKENLRKLKIKSRLIHGDIRDMPIKPGTYDFIFCHGVIEHFPDSEKAVKEGYRVLKDRGKALFSVPAKFSFFTPLKFFQKTIDKIFKTKLWRMGYEKSFSPWKFKKILKSQGFKIKKFKITQCETGKRFPVIGKILRILDKPFYWLGVGGRFMYALCDKNLKF